MTKSKSKVKRFEVKSTHLYFYSTLYNTKHLHSVKQESSVSMMQTWFNSVLKQLQKEDNSNTSVHC